MWGTANRAALIRVSSTTGTDASIEYRGADPMANPYLLIAGLLVDRGGRHRGGPRAGPPQRRAAGQLRPRARLAVRAAPRNLDEALDALVADDVLTDAFDPILVANLVDGRRAELEQFRSHVTSWERDRYLHDG